VLTSIANATTDRRLCRFRCPNAHRLFIATNIAASTHSATNATANATTIIDCTTQVRAVGGG
jgi:hypothetical protein